MRRAAAPPPVPTPPCCKTVPTPTPAPTPPPVEHAFRAVYALAADQAETPGYVAGISATIEAVNGWFATQTGGVIPRWLPGVQVVKLARPAAQYEAAGGFARMYEDSKRPRRSRPPRSGRWCGWRPAIRTARAPPPRPAWRG